MTEATYCQFRVEAETDKISFFPSFCHCTGAVLGDIQVMLVSMSIESRVYPVGLEYPNRHKARTFFSNHLHYCTFTSSNFDLVNNQPLSFNCVNGKPNTRGWRLFSKIRWCRWILLHPSRNKSPMRTRRHVPLVPQGYLAWIGVVVGRPRHWPSRAGDLATNCHSRSPYPAGPEWTLFVFTGVSPAHMGFVPTRGPHLSYLYSR